MVESTGRRNGVRLIALSVLGLVCGAVVKQAKAADTQYFTSTLSTGGTYSWDAANWSAVNGTSSGPFATNWNSSDANGDFARFYGTSATSYTVTVANTETNVGIYVNPAVTLTINQASSTSGNINISPLNGVIAGNNSVAGPLQGFFIVSGSGSLIINAPITGTGGINQRSSGSIALYGNNTFSGGFQATGGQLTYYNNNNSFGTGGISIFGSTQAFLNNGPSGVTISNPVTVQAAGYNMNLVGGSASGSTAGTNFTGAWTLPSSGTTTINTSNSAATVDEISGAIGGSSALTIADVGTMILGGTNTYTGATTVSGTATLKLLGANSIASSSSLVMSGGTLNPDGTQQTMSATTLGLTANSTIDFSGIAGELDFANSAGLSWTGTLNLVNYNSAVDFLRFGSGNTGLTASQLSKITFNGSGAGTATLDANGFLVEPSAAAPEPAMLLPLLGAGLMVVRRRRARN